MSHSNRKWHNFRGAGPYDSHKTKSLIVRGLKEAGERREILLVGGKEDFENIKVKLIKCCNGKFVFHCHTNINEAFDCLTSKDVNLIISDTDFGSLFRFYKACRTLCPLLPIMSAVLLDIEAVEDYLLIIEKEDSGEVYIKNLFPASSYDTQRMDATGDDEHNLFDRTIKMSLLRLPQLFSADEHPLVLIDKITENMNSGESTGEINLRIHKNDAGTLSLLFLSYSLMDRNKDAMATYRKIVQIDPAISINPEKVFSNTYKVGLLHLLVPEFLLKLSGKKINAAKHYEIAGKYLKSAADMNPENADVHYSLGELYEKMCKHQEAIDAYKVAIRMCPEHSLAHYALGLIYLKLTEKSNALEVYQVLQRLDPKLAQSLFDEIYR